ncbi:hypothetical protein N4Q66_26400, partial [Leclercia adecarboxylata]|uniref:hypothetical protein n=1 Tax=Leclercia adecarboxylata TaxID=83655 RepID=UPI00234CF1DB
RSSYNNTKPTRQKSNFSIYSYIVFYRFILFLSTCFFLIIIILFVVLCFFLLYIKNKFISRFFIIKFGTGFFCFIYSFSSLSAVWR